MGAERELLSRGDLSSEGTELRILPTPPVGRRPKRPVLAPLLLLLAVLVGWEFLPGALNLPRYVLPKLSAIVAALIDPNALPLYLTSLRFTLTEAFVGLAVGSVTGLVTGILLSEIRVLHRMFYPYIVAIQAVPKVALAPLFIVWFGFGMMSKIVVVVLLTFFPVLVNTLSGMRSTSQDQIDLLRANCATRSQIRWKLLIPNALPQIFTGFELAVVVAMLGAIVSEFVGAQGGLGVMILQAQFSLNIPGVFAVLIILAAIGVTLNVLTRWLRKRVLFWVVGEQV